MYNGILARQKISAFKKAGKKKIVILPYGEYGKWFESRMKYYGMDSPLYCIDNRSFDGVHVFKADDCRYEDTGITYLIATEKTEVYLQLKEDLMCRGVKAEQIESAQDGFDDIHRIMTSPDKVKVDFLCVGVPKCGTTTLRTAFMMNPHVFYPTVKNTQFLRFMSEKRHEFFKQTYAPVQKGSYSCVGGGASSYWGQAELAYHYFGSNIKVIICLRDPIKRVFSLIKYQTCYPDNATASIASCYKKYGFFSSELLDEVAPKIAARTLYYEPLEYWLKYFTREQIKIVVLEELVANPADVMDDIQDFIGLQLADKMRYETLPRSNSNNKVAIDYRCFCINAVLARASLAATDEKTRGVIGNLQRQILQHTTCECNTVMLDSTRKKLMEIFGEDIRKTETLIGRSLPYLKDWKMRL